MFSQGSLVVLCADQEGLGQAGSVLIKTRPAQVTHEPKPTLGTQGMDGQSGQPGLTSRVQSMDLTEQ